MDISIKMNLWSEAWPREPPCSAVTSLNGKWARCSPWSLSGCGGLGSRTKNNSCSLLLPLRRPWTGEREDMVPNLSPTSSYSFAFLPFLPLVSLATEPHLREPLASTPRSCCCCCLLVCRGASIPIELSFRLWFASSHSPRAVFVAHLPCFVCFCLVGSVSSEDERLCGGVWSTEIPR